jgi:hypothetical protein
MDALLVLLALSVIPAAVYAAHGGGSGRVWGLVAKGVRENGNAYRQSRTVLLGPGAAPIVVRLAAFSSFFLGVMVVPGIFAALVGFFASLMMLSEGHFEPLLVTLELSAPTGIYVALLLLSAGSSMLSRGRDAAVNARKAARWAIGHNVVLLVHVGLSVLWHRDGAGFGLGSLVYGCVSIGQALLVQRAAAALDAYERRAEDLQDVVGAAVG